MREEGHSILVTGACGYIGSHVTCKLSELGFKVIALDNLSTGKKEALLQQETFYYGDIKDSDLIKRIVLTHQCDTVLHFAASILVEESIRYPLAYFDNNVSGFISLQKALSDTPVRYFILSSTAAVYGYSQQERISESHPLQPINPYGYSKLMDEWILQEVARPRGLQYAILRYFNVAGADTLLRIGQ